MHCLGTVTAVVTPLWVSVLPQDKMCAVMVSDALEQALEISPAIYTERIFTAMEHGTLLQLEILAEKQVGSSAFSFHT